MTLTIHNLSFERNHQLLFSQLNTEVHAGELLQVRGANGSGKSTLLRILAGFIEPHSGKIFWRNKSIFPADKNYQQQLHYLGHQNGIKKSLTVFENLQLSAALSAKKITAVQLNKVIQQIGLTKKLTTQVTQLSAGQIRRLSLARLLIHPTSLWILDEPTTALDAEGQELLTDLLNQHLTNGGMAVLATHQNVLGMRTVKTIQLGMSHA